MRVLFLTVANKSHIYVAAPLAWALRNAGHEVVIASRPELESVIDATGLTGVAVGRPEPVELTSQMNEAEPEAEPVPEAPAVLKGTPPQQDYAKDDPYGELAALVPSLLPVMNPDEVFEDLVSFARDWKPDLVIWDMLSYAGPVAARAVGAAHGRLVLATDGYGQLYSASAERRAADGDPYRAWLQPKLDQFGGGEFAEDVALGQFSIDPMPDWTYHPDGVDFVPMRHVAFNGPAMADRWLFEPKTRKRVCVTLGNSHRDAGRIEASAAELLRAVSDLDVEVVATLSEEQLQELSPVPDNIRAVDFVPLNVLLATCDAIVHHGGAGTFAAAVEHGVPQLIVPSAWWSERWYGPVAMGNGVQDEGAGFYVADSDELTTEALRTHLERVLTEPSFAENAARLREATSAMPTPNDVVPVLEKLATQHRSS